MVDCLIRDGAEKEVTLPTYPESAFDTVYPVQDEKCSDGSRYRVGRTQSRCWVIVKEDPHYPTAFCQVCACSSVHAADLEILESMGRLTFSNGGPSFELADLS